jgi:hypothetical protein
VLQIEVMKLVTEQLMNQLRHCERSKRQKVEEDDDDGPEVKEEEGEGLYS